MTPHEFQAQRKATILSCYSNATDCIVKSEEVEAVENKEDREDKKEEETEKESE